MFATGRNISLSNHKEKKNYAMHNVALDAIIEGHRVAFTRDFDVPLQFGITSSSSCCIYEGDDEDGGDGGDRAVLMDG